MNSTQLRESQCPFEAVLGRNSKSNHYELLRARRTDAIDVLRVRWQAQRNRVTSRESQLSDETRAMLLKRIDLAFEVLNDAERRRLYDLRIEARQRTGQPAGRRRRPSRSKRSSATRNGLPLREPVRPVIEDDSLKRIEPIRTIAKQQQILLYEGWQFGARRRVAVKACSTKAPLSIRSDVIDEGRFLAALSHPNIVQVYLIDQTRGYYVMEYLERSLKDECLAKTPVSPELVRLRLIDMLGALKCVHDAGAMHGCIRPSSFLIGSDGRIKLKDAPGCSRSGVYALPAKTQVCVAPELLSPDTFGQPGPQSDLYMAGFTALQLLGGEKFNRWFKGIGKSPRLSDWTRWHASPIEMLPPVRTLVPELPARFAEVIDQLICKPMIERYQTAEDAIRDLEAVAFAATQLVAEADIIPPDETSEADGAEVRQVAGLPPNLFQYQEPASDTPESMDWIVNPGQLFSMLRSRSAAAIASGIGMGLLIIFLLLPPFGRGVDASVSDHTDAGNATEEFDSDEWDESERTDESSGNTSTTSHSPAEADSLASTTTGEAIADNSRSTAIRQQSSDSPPQTEPPIEPRQGAAGARIPGAPVTDSHRVRSQVLTDRQALDSQIRQRFNSILGESRTDRFVPDQTRDAASIPDDHDRFAVVGCPADRTDDYRAGLLSLAQESNLLSRRQRLKELRDLAPLDPRALFVFGCLTASEQRRQSLDAAAKLSREARVPFFLPRQMLVEDLMRSGNVSAEAVVLALVELKRDMLVFGSDRNHTIARWMGQIVGCLELLDQPGAQMLLAEYGHRVTDGLSPAARAAFADGQPWGRRHVRDEKIKHIADLFPSHDLLHIRDCIDSIPIE